MRPMTWLQALTTVSFLTIATAVLPSFAPAQTLAHELIVVSPKKMPAETRQPGLAMTLHLLAPDALYLYVEEQNGRRLAIYDVSDPAKIKLKKIVPIDATGPYDFVQSASASLELIRYRNGGRTAILDLSKPKEPTLNEIGFSEKESYIVPSAVPSSLDLPSKAVDYEVFGQSGAQPLLTIRGVLQQETDAENGTTYLLGEQGLTEIRNIKVERRLAASAPAWTNTIDDN